MKVKIRKLKKPTMPTNEQLMRFSRQLSGNDDCKSAALLCCTALTLAIAPDGERSFGSVLFYLENLISPSGITHTALEAVELWLAGLPLEANGDLAKETIFRNFRGAYLFSWQKRLIELAIDSYNELCSHEHPSELCEMAYHMALSHFNGNKDAALCDII